MKLIGLLMVNEENDILARTLDLHARFVDCFYALDGTADNTESRETIMEHPKCWGYMRDADLPRPPYPEQSVCGYRRALHEMAVADHGPDNWFLILHADEVWTEHPLNTAARNRDADGFIYLLPFFIPRAAEPWDDDTHPLDQLHWRLGPGYPEFRLFQGSRYTHYLPDQRFNTCPQGVNSVAYAAAPILHYPYRAPDVQRTRAAVHDRTQFDPDNYRHITADAGVYWTDEMIGRYQAREWFQHLTDERAVLVAA